MRELTVHDIDDLALGATLLGTGGGGDPYIGKLFVQQAIADHGPARVADADELPDDGWVLTTAIIGAPTVVIEKIPAGVEFRAGIEALASYLGVTPVALMPIEVGGLNTLIPIAAAVEMGLPVVDADGMRRAFPQIEMTVFTLAGLKATPMSVADEKGNRCVFEATTNLVAESLARAAVVQLGMANAISCYPMTVGDIRRSAIRGSMSYCTEIGRRLADVQRGSPRAWERLLSFAEAELLFSGKVIDLDRRTTEGFARGTVVLEHFDDPTRTMRVEIQNENLIAFADGEVVATVPDLICLLDHETADPITTEALAYGQRLNVLAMPCAPVQAEGAATAGAELTVPPEVLGDRAHPYSTAHGEVRVTVAPVRVLPGEAVGFWLVCELGLREWHLERTVRDVLGVLAWAVGAHLVKERLAREHDARHRLALLNEIVGSGDLPEEAIGAQMATMGWPSGGWISAFHVQVSGLVDPAWILVSTDRLGDLLAAAGGERVGARHIDELGVQRIMLGWYASEEFADLANSLLEPLVEVDADGELLRTVEAYLDAESSATNAAAVLGVHRNTVMQRMQRIVAALGVDLYDPDERLALQLVLRMQRLRSASR